jgi:hypothetical protein
MLISQLLLHKNKPWPYVRAEINRLAKELSVSTVPTNPYDGLNVNQV